MPVGRSDIRVYKHTVHPPTGTDFSLYAHRSVNLALQAILISHPQVRLIGTHPTGSQA
ncbi:hypothetical protein ES703_109612 [subsurface metagenome]